MLAFAHGLALLACVHAALAAPTPNATATATSLLSVPAYATQTEGAFATASASALASALPGYRYNLTEESESTRTSICNQTTAYCATAGCSGQGTLTDNFCNPETLGWNCKCSKGSESRLQALVVPVNTYDCRLRTSACLDQCQNPAASPPVTSPQQCKNACNYVIGSTCGTGNQVLPEYQVGGYDDKPKYYADTSKGGVALGITTSGALPISAPPSLVLSLLGVVAGAAALVV
ncbi:hypothetical protein DMC30DRAFT_144256 [Rhodotorula diobovata]|uniref:DUF7707 domain-containing protein n=1 Tax=Rhodotorula diobovata TaxID=5288 RepID=A0A5C5G026_9BASI|nr:hypothetical protein DMC30DRAFT_144256 [Rhodotorula diobovata]